MNNNIRFSDLNNNELLVVARWAFARASKHFAQYVIVDENDNIVAPAFNPCDFLRDVMGTKIAVEEVQSDWYVRTKAEIANRNAQTIKEEHYCSVIGMCNAVRDYVRWYRRLPQLGKDEDLLDVFKNTLADKNTPDIDEDLIEDDVFLQIFDSFCAVDTGNGLAKKIGIITLMNDGQLTHTQIAERIGKSRRYVSMVISMAKEHYYKNRVTE